MSAPIAVTSRTQLVELLRDDTRRCIRLRGSSSQSHRLPDLPPGAAEVSLAGLDRIERLLPDDLTCSVEPGLRREVLDEELAARGLEWPCPGAGSVGGVLALDLLGPATPGGPSPRTMLLGMEAVLAEGTPFKSGARVVKSVAGFDVHKLLLGSRGRLFATTLVHLKLRPRARTTVTFRQSGLTAPDALARFRDLRLLPEPPGRLQLERTREGDFTLAGQVAGRTQAVRDVLARHALRDSEIAPLDHLQPAIDREILMGSVVPSALPDLLAQLPGHAPVLIRGGGRFEVELSPAETDGLLPVLLGLGADAAVCQGRPDRLWTGTDRDAAVVELEARMKRALDPGGVLV